MKFWNGTAHVDLATAEYWDGAAFVPLTIAKYWNGTVFVDIPLPGGGGGSFSVTASPGSASGAVTDNNLFVNVVSNGVTVTPTGGTGPYTYLWTKVSGDSAVTVSNSTAASVTFSATVPRDQERNAVYRCTVTDSLAASAFVDVYVFLIHNSNL